MPTPHSGVPAVLPMSVPPEIVMFRLPAIVKIRHLAPATLGPTRVALCMSSRMSFFSVIPLFVSILYVPAGKWTVPPGFTALTARWMASVSAVFPSPLAP